MWTNCSIFSNSMCFQFICVYVGFFSKLRDRERGGGTYYYDVVRGKHLISYIWTKIYASFSLRISLETHIKNRTIHVWGWWASLFSLAQLSLCLFVFVSVSWGHHFASVTYHPDLSLCSLSAELQTEFRRCCQLSRSALLHDTHTRNHIRTACIQPPNSISNSPFTGRQQGRPGGDVHFIHSPNGTQQTPSL